MVFTRLPGYRYSGKKKDKVALFEFEGTGFVLTGDASPWASTSDYVYQAEVYVDGKKTETHPVPVSYRTRSNELCWNYDLPKGKHSVEIKLPIHLLITR